MRLNINLATEPYEDAGVFLGTWGSIIGGLLVLAIALGIFTGLKWRSYRQMSGNIGREQAVLADLDAKQQQDLSILNRSENKDVHDKSDFLNDLIKRKELSWTRIFTDLEGMMPPRIHVLSIEPKYNVDRLEVSLIVGSDSRERATELVRRMEKSKAFRNAHIESETQVQPGAQQQGDPWRFAILSDYNPEMNETAEAKPASADKDSGGGK